MTNTVCNIHRGYRAKSDGFVRNLIPNQEIIKFLSECRKEIRAHLKQGLRPFIYEYNSEAPDAKFRVQGSWAYGLCNLPAHNNQELDLDYGVYLSSEVFNNVEEYSKETLTKYFMTVESLLDELAKQKGWDIDSEENQNCIRLSVKKNIHIDVPVYIVPQDMFDSFEEYSDLQVGFTTGKVSIEDYLSYDSMLLDSAIQEADLDPTSYRLLYEEKFKDHINLENIHRITMVKRDGSFLASDCEQVRKWFIDFLENQEDRGLQLRFICRYLKAWRDFNWKDGGGPSSILLMIIACQNYQFIKDRDDASLLNVLNYLSQALLRPVYETRIPDHEDQDFNRIPQDKRQYCSAKSQEFFNTILDSLSSENKNYCVANHIKSYGSRFPNKVEYVEIHKINQNSDDIFSQNPSKSPQAKVLPAVTSG